MLFRSALEGGVFWGAFTFVGADLHQRFGLGFAAVGLAVAAFGGGGFLYVTVAPHLVRLLGERGLVLWGGCGLGLAFAILALAPDVSVAFAAIVVCGITFYMLHNTLQTVSTQMSLQARGTALALFSSAFFLGQTVGVAIAAPVVDHFGAQVLFVVSAALLPIHQLGADVQYTREAWLWKLEAIGREGQGDTFAALVGGLEYTFYQVGKSAADVGLLAERRVYADLESAVRLRYQPRQVLAQVAA